MKIKRGSQWKNSLKLKIIILYLILVVLPISVWGLTNIQLVTQEVEHLLLENTKILVNRQLDSIDDMYSRTTEIAAQLMLDANVRSTLKNYTGVIDKDGIQMYNELRTSMENIMIQSTEYTSILMISEPILQSENENLNPFISTSYFGNFEDLRQMKWYSYTEEVYDTPLLVQYDDGKNQAAEKDMIFLSAYKDIGSNKKLGTLCIKISKNYLKKISAIDDNDMNIQQIVYDGMGNAVFDTIENTKIEEEINDKLFSDKNNEKTFKCKIDNEDYLVLSKQSNMSKFRIAYVIPKVEFSRTLYSVQKFNILVGLLCLTFSIVVLGIIYQKILKPIAQIQKEMEKVEKGNLEIVEWNYKNDEIGRLAASFTKMLRSIKDKNHQIIEAEKKKREYEIKILQAQINPHFLYNTLDSIKWMAIVNGEKTIERMVYALGRLLRKTISDNKEFVKIEEEIENIRCYIEIQRLRYYDSFDYNENIAEDCKSVMIPRLTLQPLVENALYHGIYNCGRRGKILVDIKREGDSVKLSIIDNGRGMDIHEALQQNNTKKGDYVSKIGVQNVNERIKLYYGEKYGLSFESIKGEFTKAQLCIPYEVYTKEKEDGDVQSFNS